MPRIVRPIPPPVRGPNAADSILTFREGMEASSAFATVSDTVHPARRRPDGGGDQPANTATVALAASWPIRGVASVLCGRSGAGASG